MSISLQQMGSLSTRIGIRIRAALITMVYTKALNVDGVGNSVGDVLNLVASDCTRIMEGKNLAISHLIKRLHNDSLSMEWSFRSFSYYWITYRTYWNSCTRWFRTYFTSYSYSILPWRICSKKQIQVHHNHGRQVLHFSDSVTPLRIQTMHEILLAIKLVKFYAWEESFASEVARIREK